MADRAATSAVAVLMAVILAAGCSPPKSIARATPKATAQAFVKAMRVADYDAVAAGFDFEAVARQRNPDWDTFGQSQQNLIIDKLEEDKAAQLEALAGMMAGEGWVGEPQMQDGHAIVPVYVAGKTIRLYMTRHEDEWKILRIVEHAVM
ncbi:MAG: hypothetical protein U9R79_15535 [Armatimonadota bacterium]|nr:hypothetical protein [Armatimonadota bacterium]